MPRLSRYGSEDRNAKETNMKVGFIGLGIMGSRMAANLQKGGHELVVFNRSAEKAASLIKEGARWADTPAAVAEQVEVLFTMLAHPEAVKEMAFGDDGFLGHLRPNALWVDCSTVNPSFSRQMAEEARSRGLRFLDAPVTGTKGPAARGELVFWVGGPEADVQACRPLFDIMGRKVVHGGGYGMGTSLKMVVNLLLAEAMVAFSEGMALGQSLGISQATLFEALLGGPVVAPAVANKRGNIERGEYEADFPLRWMQKDLHLVAVTAQEQGVALPMANVAKEIYRLAIRQGLGDQDYSAIYEFLNDVSG
jgi:3-hydroxyisobutyrate dehydrogenase-like beta-hydroxyacid dehydrogenase